MNQHYFSATEAPRDDELRLLQLNTRGHHLQMWVSDQVFSTTRLDPGTRELLRAMPSPPTTGNILDIGCGWGPLAICMALESPQAQVWAVDVNPRALALTRRNTQSNNCDNVRAGEANATLQLVREEGIKFDRIVSNPPVRIGKKAVRELLNAWLSLLSPTGDAWLVMSKNLGGDSLIHWLREQGFAAEKAASRKGFRIIHISWPETGAPSIPQ